MSKKIVYTVVDNGIEGKEKTTVVYASYDEIERDKWFDTSKNKNWYRKEDEIVDTEKRRANFIKAMNPIDRMLLGIEA